MPRNKEYDRQEVLEKVVYLFWEKSFKATSMADVVKATGLNSASLYKEFGDKDNLFEAALQYYSDNIISQFVNMLIDEPNIKGIENFLNGIANLAESKGYMGCLVMNHLTVKDDLTQQANDQICEFCTDLETHLERAIGNAQSDGDLSSKKDSAVLASFVAFCVHGFVLYGKHPDKKNNIHNLYQIILKALQD